MIKKQGKMDMKNVPVLPIVKSTDNYFKKTHLTQTKKKKRRLRSNLLKEKDFHYVEKRKT